MIAGNTLGLYPVDSGIPDRRLHPERNGSPSGIIIPVFFDKRTAVVHTVFEHIIDSRRCRTKHFNGLALSRQNTTRSRIFDLGCAGTFPQQNINAVGNHHIVVAGRQEEPAASFRRKNPPTGIRTGKTVSPPLGCRYIPVSSRGIGV